MIQVEGIILKTHTDPTAVTMVAAGTPQLLQPWILFTGLLRYMALQCTAHTALPSNKGVSTGEQLASSLFSFQCLHLVFDGDASITELYLPTNLNKLFGNSLRRSGLALVGRN